MMAKIVEQQLKMDKICTMVRKSVLEESKA